MPEQGQKKNVEKNRNHTQVRSLVAKSEGNGQKNPKSKTKRPEDPKQGQQGSRSASPAGGQKKRPAEARKQRPAEVRGVRPAKDQK